MGDQPAARIDDVGIARLPDPDLRDDVPNRLQVDLGYGDSCTVTGLRQGHGHVRLRPVAEVRRAKVDRASLYLPEYRLLRLTPLVTRGIDSRPGNAKLLPP